MPTFLLQYLQALYLPSHLPTHHHHHHHHHYHNLSIAVRFGCGPAHEHATDSGDAGTEKSTKATTGKAKAGMLEGLYLFWRYRYVQVR